MPPINPKPDAVPVDSKWVSIGLTLVGSALTAYLTATTQIVRLEERLQAEVAIRSAADQRHDAERAQDRVELREQFRALSDKIDEALRVQRTR